jgi:hypothetical protein
MKIFFRRDGQLFRNPVREELPTIRTSALTQVALRVIMGPWKQPTAEKETVGCFRAGIFAVNH